MEKTDIYYRIPIFLQSIIYGATFLLFKIFCGFKVEGLENVKDLKPGVIFAPNHTSEWDGPLIRVALPFLWPLSPMYYISKSKEFYDDSGWRKILYGGTLFRLLGAYPVYSGKRDYNYSLQNYLAIVRGGGSVCIFPEGIRSKDGVMGEAHGGVAFLSKATGAPVIPVAIIGLVKFTFLDLILMRRKLIIRFGAPIMPQTLLPQSNPTVLDYKSGGAFVLREVRQLLIL